MSEEQVTEEEQVEATEEKAPKTRPKRESRATKGDRPTRVPVSGHRDILTVHGKDPEYEYRWIHDVNEEGERIEKHLAAGYEFVTNSEISGVGQRRVGNESGSGSIVRKPSGGYSVLGEPTYLYLMRIHKEYYEEDQKAKVNETINVERRMYDEMVNQKDHYGNINIERK